MEMNPMQGQMPPEEAGDDHMSLMKQAYELLGKAIAAAGVEEGAEGDKMSVEQAFGQGFEDPKAAPKY